MASLEAYRTRFVEILEASKNLRELLNEQNFDEIIAASPNLQKRANLIGEKGVRNIITGQIDRMAIKEPALFESLRIASDTLKKAKESRQTKFKEIEELCERYNVDEEELAGILGATKIDKSKLKKIVSQGMGFFGRFRKKEIEQRAKSLISLDPKEINTIITEINQGMRELGEALAATISESPDARKALASILRSERPETKKESGFTFQEVASRISQESAEDLEKEARGEWNKIKPESQTEEKRKELREQFIEKGVGKRIGFWAIILEIMFGVLFDKAVPETKETSTQGQ